MNLNEWTWMNKLEWINSNEWTLMNELEWINSNEWTIMNELEWMNLMNLNEWTWINELEWKNVNEWTIQTHQTCSFRTGRAIVLPKNEFPFIPPPPDFHCDGFPPLTGLICHRIRGSLSIFRNTTTEKHDSTRGRKTCHCCTGDA